MKIAIVTGGSRGLGKNASLNIAKNGMGVILTYNSNKDEADKVVHEIESNGGKAVALQLDVSNSSSFSKFADEVSEVLNTKWDKSNFDYLVNNAGVGLHSSFEKTTEEQFDNLMNIHFKGTFFLTQKLLPLLADNGRILNISSGLTRFSFPGYAAYASMKGAVEVLTRYLAKELGPRGISVNTLAPGAIETDFGGGASRDNPEVNKQIASVTALGRVGLPDDIGGLIASLLSDETKWINAQRIEASGGMMV